jgi:signal recognition particle subunit SRP68
MDITKFVVSGRVQARLYGDESTYQRQLGKKLLNCRKKLGIATRGRGKYQAKEAVTAGDIGNNHEYG